MQFLRRVERVVTPLAITSVRQYFFPRHTAALPIGRREADADARASASASRAETLNNATPLGRLLRVSLKLRH